MAWMGSLLGAAKQGVRIEWALSDPQAIARAVFGVALAAVTGYLLDDPFAAAMLSVGAFLTGISSLLARRRHRLTVAVTHAGLLAAAAAVGAVVHPFTWLFLLLLFAGAFTAGWLRVFGAAPSIRGCLVMIGLMITADMSPTTEAGLQMAGYLGVGAGMVVIAQLLPPYGPRWAHQRRSIAAVYEALAAAARRTAEDSWDSTFTPVSLAVLTNARRSLDVLPGPLRPTTAPLFGLLGEAERLLRSIRTLNRSPVPVDAVALEQRRARCTAVADVLGAIASTVRTGRRVQPPPDAWAWLSADETTTRPREPSVGEPVAPLSTRTCPCWPTACARPAG